MMRILKSPILRVPLVLSITGILCRILTYILSFIWTRIQIAHGPDPVTGTYTSGSGGLTIVLSVIACLLFWAAGWRYLQHMTFRQIFASATIMVIWYALLLTAEQLLQAMGSYPMWVYTLYATHESCAWVDQLLIRIFDEVSVRVMILGLFAPYLYLVFGRRST